MSNYWSVHLPHVLDEKGTLRGLTGRGLRNATFWTEIVAQASNYEEPTTIKCRRRPGRKPCGGLLTIFFDVDNFDVLWFCPECEDVLRLAGPFGYPYPRPATASQRRDSDSPPGLSSKAPSSPSLHPCSERAICGEAEICDRRAEKRASFCELTESRT